MNREEAAKLVSVMLASCPAQARGLDRDRVAGMIDAYASLLDDIPYAIAQAALRVILHSSTWLPSVAEIRSAVLELSRGPARPGGEAWGQVLKLIGRYGMNRNPGEDFKIEDPLTASVVASFGWRELCTSTNQTADRARFIELYDKLTTQARREVQAPMLAAAKEARARPVPALTRADAIHRALEDGES